jgi:hypothetical protein
MEISVEMKFDPKELKDLSMEEGLSRLQSATAEMAQKQMAGMLAEVSKVCDRTGNVLNLKGRALDADAYIQMLEMIFLGFEANGNPRLPTVVGGPGAALAMQKVAQELFADRIKRERFMDLINKKRMEWNARENSRKLVG